jgi:hypothetical protein
MAGAILVACFWQLWICCWKSSLLFGLSSSNCSVAWVSLPGQFPNGIFQFLCSVDMLHQLPGLLQGPSATEAATLAPKL